MRFQSIISTAVLALTMSVTARVNVPSITTADVSSTLSSVHTLITAFSTLTNSSPTANSSHPDTNSTCLLSADKDLAFSLLPTGWCGHNGAGVPVKVNMHHYRVAGGVVTYICNLGGGLEYCYSENVESAAQSLSGCRGDEVDVGGLTVGFAPINSTFCRGTRAACNAIEGSDGCLPGQSYTSVSLYRGTQSA